MSNHKASYELRMAAITTTTITMHPEQPVYRVAIFSRVLPQGWWWAARRDSSWR